MRPAYRTQRFGVWMQGVDLFLLLCPNRCPLLLTTYSFAATWGGPEAEALMDIGLLEGTRNTHPGQGTANRRFFFDGAFIELLWVSNPVEAQSPLTAPTKLGARWAGRKHGLCPFGIAFSPTAAEVPEPPFSAWAYRPQYLPPSKPFILPRTPHFTSQSCSTWGGAIRRCQRQGCWAFTHQRITNSP